AIAFDEVAIREQLLEFEANLFPALGAAVAGENGTAIRHELIEVVEHCCLLRTRDCLASLIAPASARAMGRASAYTSRKLGTEQQPNSRPPARRWLYPRLARLRPRARP